MENSCIGGPAGLYIHVPYCIRKCLYCDFYSITDLGSSGAYVACLEQEMKQVDRPGCTFDTIHLGGGTPSLLAPRQVETILAAAYDSFPFEKAIEVTVEVNPGTLTPDFLEAFLGAGGNRVNLGVQSFRNDHLAFLGRIHTADQAGHGIELARKAGVENLGIDLIYGLPGQGRTDWLEDLSRAVRYGPEHISCYMLTYEKGTALDRKRSAGRFRPMKDKELGALFDETIGFLGENGYEQYEISNFSRGGRYPSHHNWKYWSHQPYIGLGPSAHSFIPLRRWWNSKDLRVYLNRLGKGLLAVAEHENLSLRQHMLEAFFLGMRTTAGIDRAAFERKFGEDFKEVFSKTLKTLCERGMDGLVEVTERRCALTRKGQVFADSINAVFAEGIRADSYEP